MIRAAPLFLTLALWASGLCAAAQFSKIALVLPELADVYPGSGLGFLVSSISVVGALLGLLAGAAAVRLGNRRLLLGGMVLAALVSSLQALLLPLPLLLLSRVIEGIAHLAIVVAAPTLIAQIASDRWRSAAMTLWATFFGVAFALTAWLGLPLVDARGVEALFAVHAGCTAAMAVLLAILLPRDRTTTPVGEPLRGGDIARRHARAWGSPAIAAPAAGWLFYTLTFVALLALLPALMPPHERTFTAAALPLASIAASMTVGVILLQLMSAVKVICTGFGVAIVLCLALMAWPGQVMASMALFAALGLVQGASFAAVPQLNPNSADQSLANGALAQAGNVGNLLGTPLLLAVLTAGGLEAVVALVIGCYLCALCTHALLAHRRRPTPPSPP